MKQKGYSITELLIAAAIGGSLLVIISIIAVIGFSQMSSLRDRLAAEEALDKVELYFKATLGQAVDITGTNLAIGGFPFAVPSWQGALAADFTWDQIADSANWSVIGYFYRETGGSGLQSVEGVGGTLRPTAIFYRRPDAAQRTSGVLFFDDGGTTTLSPDYSDRFVDRISYLQMRKNINTAYNKVASVSFRVAIRYHDYGVAERTWCPVLDITNAVANCVNRAKYRDLDREFTVLIRNNLLKASGTTGMTGITAEERIMDSLYFFRLVSPATE